MSDLIRRQAAIDALAEMHCKSDEDGYVWIVRSDAWSRIDALPSAQPEIVRCEDCKYNYANMIPDGKGCQRNVYIEVDDNFFCADGEREVTE